MESQSTALWNFLSIAYRKGLLDELTPLLGAMTDPDAELGGLLAKLEDVVAPIDLAPFDRTWRDKIEPALRAFSDEQAMDALKLIVATLRPALIGDGGGIRVVLDLAQSLAPLKPALIVILPAAIKAAAPFLESFLREQAGRIIGSAIGAACIAVNELNTRDPGILKKFCTDLFATLDRDEFRKTLDIVLGNVLDQKPALFGWAFSTAFTRMKRRFLG